MPQFDPTSYPSQIFWLIVCFVALYLLMSRVALPRIAEVLEERANRIAADLEKAAMLKQEAESVIAAYEAAVAEARREATTVIGKASAEISELSAKRQAEFAAELSRKVAEAEGRIASAKDEAKAQVRAIATEAASSVAARLTGAMPDAAIVERAVEAAMKEAAG